MYFTAFFTIDSSNFETLAEDKMRPVVKQVLIGVKMLKICLIHFKHLKYK